MIIMTTLLSMEENDSVTSNYTHILIFNRYKNKTIRSFFT